MALSRKSRPMPIKIMLVFLFFIVFSCFSGSKNIVFLHSQDT
jgi:hypothetical protein